MKRTTLHGGRVASRGLVALWMVIGVLSAIGILSGIPRAARAATVTLDQVSFTTLPGNEVQVRLGLSGPPGKPPQSFTIDNPARIAVDFADTGLNLADRHRAIGGPAQSVTAVEAGGRTFPHEGGARMVITPSGHYEHLAYQSDKVLTVDVKPLTKEEEQALKKEKFGYTGEKLSLNFQDIEVRAVLQLIADFTGLNMVASDTVAGNVTLRLKNVPWDQALEIILKSKGLGMRQAGNVMMVAPQEEIAAREKLELESQKQLAELAPLKTEFIEVNYAKAADVATLLKTEGNEGNKLVSKDGRVSVDQRTNTTSEAKP
jgi:type IV pilus assembly protein PilQ